MKLTLDVVTADQGEFCQFLLSWITDKLMFAQFDEKFLLDLIYDLSQATRPEQANNILKLIYAKHVLCSTWTTHSKHYDMWVAKAAVEFAKWKLTITVPDVALHDVFSI
jgi:hypothetical protein